MSGFGPRLGNKLAAIVAALMFAGSPVVWAEDSTPSAGQGQGADAPVETKPADSSNNPSPAPTAVQSTVAPGQQVPPSQPAQAVAPAGLPTAPPGASVSPPSSKVPTPVKASPAPAARPAAPPAASKPVVLFGRIEEIATGAGARLPVRLKAMIPKMDTSKQLKGGAQSIMGRVVGSFPIDWRGVWNGTLKIHASVLDPVRWQFDPDEANKERELLRAGTEGRVTFRFTTSQTRQIKLEPASVVFAAPMDRSRYAQMMNQLQAMLMGGQAQPGAVMMQGIPYLYALHLGDLQNGVGVTGNSLQSRVIRNDITELAPGVLEQVVVTYNLVRNPTTGKSRYGYSENVVRFTRQTSNKLYVQAATVSYLSNGRFEDKTILYGMVTRGQGASSHPLDGLMPGFSFPQ